MNTAPNFVLPEHFETERFVLRRPNAGDAKAVYAYASDPDVCRFAAWDKQRSISESEVFLEDVQKEWETKTGFAMAINWKDSPDQALGVIHTHLDAHGISYGYALQKSAWDQGVASECLTALSQHAMAQPDVYRVSAFCDVDNIASSRVMEKAGMTREGVLKRYFIHPNISPEPRDCFIYARTK